MILVTGANGNVGREVVDGLWRRGERVRLFTRRPEGARRDDSDRLEAVPGDFNRPETFVPALAGVHAVFLMNRGLDLPSLHAFVGVAKASGCSRIVFLSSLAAANPALAIGRIHAEQEAAIQASALSTKVLRAGGFMSNALQWKPDMDKSGVVPNPLGDAAYAPISPTDIAAVAIVALTTADRGHRVYDLTGGELLTLPQQVAVLADVLGRPLRAAAITRQEAIAGMVGAGIPEPMAAAVADSLDAVRNGQGAQMTDTVRQVLGRPPRTFRQWAEANAARF